MAQGYQNKINKENTNGKQERKKRKKGIGERAGCVFASPFGLVL